MNTKNKRVVIVSGGFDPVHIGHVRMFNEAKALGDHLIVVLNNDNWLRKKKGYVFMGEKEREEIIRNFKAVDDVYVTDHTEDSNDTSVCSALESICPHIFANGGDRKEDNIPEYEVCRRLNIKMHFNTGSGGKVQSSSWLVNNAEKRTDKLKKRA